MKEINDFQVLSNAVRYLSIDMVEEASSGHPGAPLGMADIATVLWKEVLRFNPQEPMSVDRDRVVLSNGHASAMLYAVLYLAGYPISLDDLKAFRQVHSKTPGHPEIDKSLGIEVSSGPLGQGLANAVGMAMARAHADKSQKNDYTVYCFVGDGCLMEGISYEACSLAGTLKLNDLIVLYDANQVSIDGDISAWFDEDVAGRFSSQGWHVIEDVDGHDYKAIKDALTQAKAYKSGPVMIVFRTIIGRYVPDWCGKSEVHGQPLGQARAQLTKSAMGLEGAPFCLPDAIINKWREQQPSQCSSFTKQAPYDPEVDWSAVYAWAQSQTKAVATRKASFEVLCQLPDIFVGGSADLTGSVLTHVPTQLGMTKKKHDGRYVQFGVREFAMCAIANGIAVEQTCIPYVGTFLVFADYAKNAIRMAALMRLQVIYVLTHDSIGLGEDGPTHQPVEQLAMLRATPNTYVWRPCDIDEVVAAWQHGCQSKNNPTCMILSRQTLPRMRSKKRIEILQGAYSIRLNENPALILIATGSEVSLACEVADRLSELRVEVRVVSMPCMELFREQPKDYQEALLPQNIPKVAIEAASSQSWHEWVGQTGLIIGLDEFGHSGKGVDVQKTLGFEVAKIVENVLKKYTSLTSSGEKA